MPQFARPPPVKQLRTDKVTPKDLSAAYKLFHNRYQCTTSQMNYYSKEYLSTFGMVTTGDKAADDAMAHSTVNVWLTPAAMAIFLNEGSVFGLVDRKSSIEIYGLLMEHLRDWQQHLRLELNPKDVPWEDLRQFEALAKEMFPIASGFVQNLEQPFSHFVNRSGGIMRGLKREAPPPVTSVPGTSEITERGFQPILDTMMQEVKTPSPEPSKKSKPWLR